MSTVWVTFFSYNRSRCLLESNFCFVLFGQLVGFVFLGIPKSMLKKVWQYWICLQFGGGGAMTSL